MRHATWLIAGLAMTVTGGTAHAQRKLPFSPKATAKANAAQGAIDREQDRKQRLNQAKRNLTKAEIVAIAAASQEIAAAKAAHRAAVKQFQTTRDSAEKAVETSLRTNKAREEAAAAQTAYREAADPVLHDLKATADYQAAEKTALAARTALQELKNDSSLSENDRAAQSRKLADESMAASSLERQALQIDPRVSTARQRMEAARNRLADLQKQAEQRVENDSSVVAAQQAVKEAFGSVQAAEARLVAVQQKAAIGEQMLGAGVIPRVANRDGKGNNQGKGGK